MKLVCFCWWFACFVVFSVIKCDCNKISKQSSLLRRLQQTGSINNGVQNTELLIIISESLYLEYFNKYGSQDWYNELNVWIANTINSVNDYFSTTNWGNDIGIINVGVSEIDIVTSYTGDHSILAPIYSSGSTYPDTIQLVYDIETYVKDYKDSTKLDAAMLLTVDALGIGGRATESTICKSNRRAVSVTSIYSSGVAYVETIAHELAHNFGAYPHDDETSCGANGGIMGSGWNDWQFSQCSIDMITDYIKNECPNNCSCFGDDINWTNDYPDNSFINTCDLSNAPECLEITGISNLTSIYDNNSIIDVNGLYSLQGCHRGYPYYQSESTGYYLYYSERWQGYNLFKGKSVRNAYAWCSGDSPMNCENGGSNWWIYDNDNWVSQSNGESIISNGIEAKQIVGLQVKWGTVNHDLTGVYQYVEEYNGYPVYSTDIEGVVWYLFYYSQWSGYVIGTSYNAQSDGWAFCDNIDPINCNQNQWEAYWNGWGTYDIDATCTDTSVCA